MKMTCPVDIDPSRWFRLTERERCEVFFLPVSERRKRVAELAPKSARDPFASHAKIPKPVRHVMREGKAKQAKLKALREKPASEKPNERKKKKIPKRLRKPEPTAYQVFLASAYWVRVRKMVFERDGKKCTSCGSGEKLQCHHLTYENHGKEAENLGDLVTLCRGCHETEHGITRK